MWATCGLSVTLPMMSFIIIQSCIFEKVCVLCALQSIIVRVMILIIVKNQTNNNLSEKYLWNLQAGPFELTDLMQLYFQRCPMK